MANRLLLAAVLTISVSTTPTGFAQAPARGSGDIDITGPVRVIDGDTIEVYINGRQTGIGLIGIKAPLANTDCGKTSTGFLWSLLRRQGGLRLVEDPNYQFDARKRRMYYLRLPDNSSASIEIARAGMATPIQEGAEASDIAAAATDAATARVRRGCASLK